jgi:death-on-curing protein
MTLPEFLTVDDVIDNHAHQVEQFGGSHGLRDRGLLESAVAQAEVSFGGEYVHPDLFAMAAAYLFHLVSNHAFIDGNKRVGLAAALVFLDLNGEAIETGTEQLYELTMGVACGEIDRDTVAASLRELRSGSIAL